MTTTTTITISFDRLQQHDITVSADSTVELVERETSTNNYMALLVDGRHYDLVMCKHISGRPEIEVALAEALAAVQGAIAALQPAATTVAIDIDALTAAYDVAQALCPDRKKGWGKAVRAAYEWLMQVWGDEGVLLVEDGHLLVESATEPGKVYRANGTCSCAAYDDGIAFRGTPGVCWHRAAAKLVVRMQERQREDRALAAFLAAGDDVYHALTSDEQAHFWARYEGFTAEFASPRRAQVSKEAAQARLIACADQPTVAQRLAVARAELLECFA